MNNKIIVVAGPTASGKTAVGIEIAKSVGGEIISADSMQVYKGMPVATAAPTPEECSKVPHHLTEFLSPDESFSVAAWCDLAKKTADDILSRGKVPVIVGGTGLFIDSFVDNLSFEDVEIDTALRERLMKKDIDELYSELMAVDKNAAENIHKNNKKRVVRALELYYSGVTKTQQNINSRKEKSPYEFLYFVLTYSDRQTLYDRINRRVDLMVQNGLVDEAKTALSSDGKTSAQAIGHKELKPYFEGEITLDKALDNLKKETRHYAKRQITWFKRRNDAVFLNLDGNREDAVRLAVSQCEEFLNG
ncbi:MAG: tRNA (adenosine(37)-N6)-dimethylallyltransferase MiaA [Eubacteriales bacterium]|nr:tRNA (adenosine(37)-N6)-dimethylallyltransferase MiaA [Eubacteriales bacterium]